MIDDVLQAETCRRSKLTEGLDLFIFDDDAGVGIDEVVFIDLRVCDLAHLVFDELIDSVDGLEVQVEVELS